jgi:hypothetical protein
MESKVERTIPGWLIALIIGGAGLYWWYFEKDQNKSANNGVEIEMLSFADGDWNSVITVHGFFDNREAAHDIITGLNSVSDSRGTLRRRYRVVDK